MERTISVEERIKRAEERYYNSENKFQEKPNTIQNEKMKNKNNKLIKKLLKEIVICLIIYLCFYGIRSSNSLFSEDFIKKAKEVLSTDIDINKICITIKNEVEKIINKNNFQNQPSEENNNKEENIEVENSNQEQSNVEEIQTNEKNIGGAVEEQNNLAETIEENTVELSQMEKDANYVKENFNIIKPIEGIISSKYGLRNPTTSTVPKNHTGIDLAAKIGTKIVAAIDGKVILNSSKGDYGKHLKIQNGETIFVYAHCNKLYVNEGDDIKQGQEIAEVGATGNTTGPHLHFEIRYQDRYIDPEMILDFSKEV